MDADAPSHPQGRFNVVDLKGDHETMRLGRQPRAHVGAEKHGVVLEQERDGQYDGQSSVGENHPADAGVGQELEALAALQDLQTVIFGLRAITLILQRAPVIGTKVPAGARLSVGPRVGLGTFGLAARTLQSLMS